MLLETCLFVLSSGLLAGFATLSLWSWVGHISTFVIEVWATPALCCCRSCHWRMLFMWDFGIAFLKLMPFSIVQRLGKLKCCCTPSMMSYSLNLFGVLHSKQTVVPLLISETASLTPISFHQWPFWNCSLSCLLQCCSFVSSYCSSHTLHLLLLYSFSLSSSLIIPFFAVCLTWSSASSRPVY